MTDEIKPPSALILAGLEALPAIAWCDKHRLKFHEIEAVTVAAYIEQLGNQPSKPTVKQHLGAIRQLCDYLTNGGILEVNPAVEVRGPKYVLKRGKTPVLSAAERASCSIQLKVIF